MAGRGVHDHAGRLVDHRERIILVHHREVARFRGACRAWLSSAVHFPVGDVHHGGVTHALTRAAGTAVHGHEPGVDERPSGVASDAPRVREPDVEARRLDRSAAGGHAHLDATGDVCGGKKLSTSSTMMAITMQLSATLNTGHQWKSMKSTTYPCTSRSTPLEMAPPRIIPMRTCRYQVVPCL